MDWLRDPGEARFEPSDDDPEIVGHYVWDRLLMLTRFQGVIHSLEDEPSPD